MGKSSDRSTTPDLFSKASTRERSSPTVNPPPSSPATTDAATAPSLRLVLPKDLPGAIKRLEDQDLDRLLSAALAEQQRRGRRSSVADETLRKQRVEAVAVPLTQGKLNAVRAAFKAGISPSKIARQFGLSQSDVRKALASGGSRKASDRD
jgi:DNA invertase Pin-like site-specific DNA recombinase